MCFRITTSPGQTAEHITIVLMSSNYYVPYLSVCLQSLISNCHSNVYYDIIVLQREITEENQRQLIEQCVTRNQISLRFYNPEQRLEQVNFHIAAPTYAREAYYRILTPWILQDYTKAIVMDCDIVVKRDVSELYRLELGNALAAGVRDVVYQGMLSGVSPDELYYCTTEMGMKDPYSYINTGVLLLNLAQWRKEFTEKEIISFAQSHKFRIQEQDVLNVLVEGKVLFINPAWNFFVPVNDWVTACVEAAPETTQEYYRQAQEQPCLIHFANIPKPWDDPEIPFAPIFWTTARQSPYYETILARLVDLKCKQGPVASHSRCHLHDILYQIGTVFFPLGSRRRKAIKLFLIAIHIKKI